MPATKGHHVFVPPHTLTVLLDVIRDSQLGCTYAHMPIICIY
jgi:hypothetical protein